MDRIYWNCASGRFRAKLNNGFPVQPFRERGGNAIKALQSDLETLDARGWTVVPLSWVAEWVAGDRDECTLPHKAVAIAFDDGADHDLFDSDVCGYLPGGLTVLQQFKQAHPRLPAYSPQVTTFVIAVPLARLHRGNLRDDWWWSCQNASNRICVVGNHSVDHDTPSVWVKAWDPDLQTDVRIASNVDESWNRPTGDFTRIDSESTSHQEVYGAAHFISHRTGVWPELFAYPFGQASDYLRLEYFPNNEELQTYAAFCRGGKAATRKSNRYCIPRFVYAENWSTPEEFLSILAEPEKTPVRRPGLAFGVRVSIVSEVEAKSMLTLTPICDLRKC